MLRNVPCRGPCAHPALLGRAVPQEQLATGVVANFCTPLEGLNQEKYGRWGDYATWDHGPRRLTIIDHALAGVVEENQIKAG
jgi:hypothetical protein